MSAEAHYAFPPARAYALNRCLYAIKSDAAFRARYLVDPEGTARDAGLDDEDRAAVVAGDRDRLVARGAHPYLVFMADLRLRMERGGSRFELF